MLKFKHFWNYHSISPNQLTISFCWFKFTWMCFTNFHEKHRQLRVGGSCLWSPTKTWAIREVWQLLGSSQKKKKNNNTIRCELHVPEQYYYPSCWEKFGTHGEMRDEIHADPSRRATSFESSVISGSFERFWESKNFITQHSQATMWIY